MMILKNKTWLTANLYVSLVSKESWFLQCPLFVGFFFLVFFFVVFFQCPFFLISLVFLGNFENKSKPNRSTTDHIHLLRYFMVFNFCQGIINTGLDRLMGNGD